MRHDDLKGREVEDGMGFAGLAPTAEERREQRETTRLREFLKNVGGKLDVIAIEVGANGFDSLRDQLQGISAMLKKRAAATPQ